MIALKHFQLLRGFFHGYQRGNFSNLIKQTPLSFEDLVSKTESPLKKKKINQSKQDQEKIQFTLKGHKKVVKLNPLQFSTIHLINQSIKQSQSMKPKAQRSFKDNNNLSRQERDNYSIQFMKYLDGFLSRNQSLAIISEIENYNSSIKKKITNSSFTPFVSENKNSQDKQQREFFKKLRERLIQDLNYYLENIEDNDNLIEELFKLLPMTNLSLINLENFQRECPQSDQYSGRNNLVSDYLADFCSYKSKKFIQEGQSEDTNFDNKAESHISQATKSKKALQDALKLNDKTKLSKLHIRKIVPQNKADNQDYQYKMASDKIVFHKIIPEKSKFSSRILEADQRSAYIYELPFNLEQSQTEQFINFLKDKKGIQVESFILFPYKSFLQRNFFEIVYRIPQNYNDKRLETGIQRIVKVDNIQKYLSKNGKKERYTKVIKKSKSIFDDVPLQNQPAKIKSVTDALLLKIKKQTYSKFNKSSMVIRFATKEDKQKVLNKQSRLYGLNYKNFKNIKFQEGYAKRTVSLTGFPWGCSSKELQVYLNSILQPLKIPVSCPQDCVMTKNYILLQFEHLTQALIAISKLNNTSFQNKNLKAQLNYGSLRLFRGEYYQNEDGTSAKLKKKIEQCGILEEAKFVSRKFSYDQPSLQALKQISKGKNKSEI